MDYPFLLMRITMRNPWLILDGSNLAWRAFYSTGGLTYGGMSTGVIYGFLRDLITLSNQFKTCKFAFCWDRFGTISKRKQIFKDYKAQRKLTPTLGPLNKLACMEQVKDMQHVAREIATIYEEVLPTLGFKNNFWADGYEADDLIASVCLELYEPGIIVSSDKDLFQCLTGKISQWRPVKNKLITTKDFESEYGIKPSQWPMVKAIAGCISDNVPGIKGIGELTAIKYLTGKLSKKCKAFGRIDNQQGKIAEYLKLTKLPFEGTPRCELQLDEMSKTEWGKVVKKFGLNSLKNKTLYQGGE